MPVLGIIAEFNPLHNGHIHFLHSAQQSQDFAATICVMSGNFVQRGEAALCNKWVRAQMALQAGIDLVIELPFSFAVRSAYFFARGGIQLLNRTGVVSHLAFGSESGCLEELQSVAAIIAHEDEEYKAHLKSNLSAGLSFPAARSKAVQAVIGNKQINNVDALVAQPNNILALEYLRVLEQEAIPIQPITILRQGQGYNSLALSDYASATAIRHFLYQHPQNHSNLKALPENSLSLLQHEILSGRAPITTASLEQALLIKLRTIPLTNLAKIYEITEGLEHRVHTAALANGSWEELRQAIKSKRYSLTRINRLLLYILLNIEKQQILSFDQHGPLYIHILGFSTKGRKILQEIKNKSSLRILNRGSEVKGAFEDNSNEILQAMLGLDIRATNIYTLLYPNSSTRHGNQDFTTSPVMIEN